MKQLLKVQKVDLERAERVLRLQYARNVALLEIDLSSGIPESKSKEIEELRLYASSTIKRRNFILHCVVARIDNNYLLVSDSIKSIGVSRAAMDVMIKECEEAKWIFVKRNKQGHRRIQGTDIVVTSMLQYTDHLVNLVDKFETNSLVRSIQQIAKTQFLLDTN